jgi:hypothetical protein
MWKRWHRCSGMEHLEQTIMDKENKVKNIGLLRGHFFLIVFPLMSIGALIAIPPIHTSLENGLLRGPIFFAFSHYCCSLTQNPSPPYHYICVIFCHSWLTQQFCSKRW